jgi:uncharacterized repeat protein (TIGR01451 family)
MKDLMALRQMCRSLLARLSGIVLLVAFIATTVLVVVFLSTYLAGCSGSGGGDGAGPAADPIHALAIAPPLGTSQNFAVLGGAAVTNTGSSIITGDLGVDPGTSITGFPPGIVTGGTTHAADAVALQAQIDTTTAYNALAGQACTTTYIVPTDIGGMTLVPGVYCFSSSAQLTGTVTLDAGGDATAVWVFEIGSTLTTASNSSVLVINGGQPCNVFWQVGSSATLGTTTSFIGNILALTSITLDTGANVSGSVLARNGAVTMDSNDVAIAVCSVVTSTPIPPTLSKAFNPATIDAGGSSILTITLSNPNSTVATLTAPFIDTLPSGVVTALTSSTNCGGTLAIGTSTVTLTGSSIPANGSCTVTVPVTAPSGGSFINSLAIGALQTSNGSNAAPAVATLTVPLPPTAPTLGKAFSPATIVTGGVSTLTITLTNPNSSVATLSTSLTDTLPAGVVIANPTNASTTCPGSGGVTATHGGTSVTLQTPLSIPASGSCTVMVDVTASSGGSYFNSLAAGALQTSNGSNAAPAVATLTVTSPANVTPTLGKAFSPATIATGGVSTLTITLSNTNASVATLSSSLTDTLPTGVVIANPSNASTTCPGSGGVVATTGGSTVTLKTPNSIPASGSCTVTVDVTSPLGGSYFNSLPIGALQTSNGSNAAPAIATLTVSPPSAVTIGKAFSPATINVGGDSILTITLSNTGSSVANLTAPLTDILPSGVVVASVSAESNQEVRWDEIVNGSTTCGGTVTANTGASTVTLTGGSIPANGSCTVTVTVTAPVGGVYFNSLAAGALQTSNGSNAAPAVATLTVNIAASVTPSLSKTFSPATINAGGSSTLTITLNNPNSKVAKLTAPLTDTLPSGVVVAAIAAENNQEVRWDESPQGSNTCGGTVTANTGASTVTLTGGSIPANGSCTVTVNVTAKSKGSYTNNLPSGALQTNKGSNAAPAVAILTVNLAAPSLSKNFTPATINPGGDSTLTITLTNPNSTVANMTAPLTDNFPSGMVVAGTGEGQKMDWENTPGGSTSNGSTTCGGTLTANKGGSQVILMGGKIPANGSCKVTVNVTANNKGSYSNNLPAGALQTNNGNNAVPASAILTVLQTKNGW